MRCLLWRLTALINEAIQMAMQSSLESLNDDPLQTLKSSCLNAIREECWA